MAAALRLATLGFLSALFVTVARADIVIGTPRAGVITELGKPSSTAQRGPREILLYPKGVRLELENGVVADIKGYAPGPGAPPVAVPPAVTPPKPEPAPGTAAPLAKTAPKPKPPEAAGDYNPAIAANALGNEVAKMDTAWGSAPPKMHQRSYSSIFWLELGIALALRFGFTLLALRLAFKYWEMDAFWSGTLAITGIDVAIHAVLETLGPVSSGITTMAALENGLPGIVMIFTIRHFCFNKRIQNAVLTASFVKVLVTLVNLYLSLFLLRLFFG